MKLWCASALLCCSARARSLLFLSSSSLSPPSCPTTALLVDRPPLPRSRYWVGPRPSLSIARRSPRPSESTEHRPALPGYLHRSYPLPRKYRAAGSGLQSPPRRRQLNVIIAALIVRGSPTPCPPWLPVSRCQRSNNQAPFFKPSEPSLPRRLEFRLQPMANTPLWSLLHVLPRS